LAPADEWEAWFHVVGADGELRGTIGALIGEPGSTADSIEVRLRGDEATREDRQLPGDWFPGAFAGPMEALMQSIGDSSEPPTSAADAVRTLELVRAAELSHESGRPVSLPLART
jgi:predicted dehydrogenase